MQERVLCRLPCQALPTGSCYPPPPSPTERRRCSDNTVLCWERWGCGISWAEVGGGIEGCKLTPSPGGEEKSF